MKNIFILLCLLSIGFTGFAQKKNILKDTTVKEISLEEVVISASNFAEKKKNIAQKIDVISAKTIAQANAQNTGDLLISTGKIFVQKSQQTETDSADFFVQYQQGKTDDDEDTFDWASNYRHYLALRQELEGKLRNVA